MKYEELASINVNSHVEKKQNLSYLSWAWAVDQLLRRDPEATWTYDEPARYGETLMVFCAVTAFGRTRKAQLPVMDHRNKAIANPDAFQVNVAMQRCLAKAIALHGIGLYIYAGEDLPMSDGATDPAGQADGSQEVHQGKGVITATGGVWDTLTKDVQNFLTQLEGEVRQKLQAGDAHAAVKHLEAANLGADEKTALWGHFDSKERSAMKKVTQLKEAA